MLREKTNKINPIVAESSRQHERDKQDVYRTQMAACLVLTL